MAEEKELKDQRVPIMMSSSELEAIDDWMFKSRIRSRGEAIRRLCQLALMTDHMAAVTTGHVADSAGKIREAMTALGAMIQGSQELASQIGPIGEGLDQALFDLMDARVELKALTTLGAKMGSIESDDSIAPALVGISDSKTMRKVIDRTKAGLRDPEKRK